MKKKILILGTIFSALTITSCVKDLDVKPTDVNTILQANLGDNPEYLKETLGKVYASFIINGQGTTSGGGADITASDVDFFTTTRALWNCQEITTDEAICAWGDVGIADLNTQTWSKQNPFITALYQRLGLSVTYANAVIKYTAGSSDATYKRYNAEARFLRALAYAWDLDLFGNPPFTTEADGVGKFFPKQLDPEFAKGRAKLFNYVVSELHSISGNLGAAGGVSTQANKASCWMLLARVYLNAEVYTGTAKWDSCKIYCDSVINCGKYSLATNYRQNFSADNTYPGNPELILGWEQDGSFTQGYVGTTFIIESSSDSKYIDATRFHGLTSNTDWNGNRTKKKFMNILVDTLTTYSGKSIPASDSTFAQSADKRVYLKTKASMDIPSAGASGDYGIGVYKFTAKNSNGSYGKDNIADWNAAYACTDFPVFRLADAYMMRAEALFNLNNSDAAALADVNYIRDRAFGAGSFGSNPANHFNALTAQILLDERGREFYYEAQRRTDLIRFGKFTNGDYNWEWKGGAKNGVNTDAHYNVFPIPGDEVSANPFLHQNPNY